MSKGKGKAKFLVDIFLPYVYSVVVEASDENEAENLVDRALTAGKIDPSNFHPTEDSIEISVYGEVDNDGPHPWPELEVEDGKTDGR